MKLNIRLSTGELEEVNGFILHFEYENIFKMFSHKDNRDIWHVSEFSTGMQLGDGNSNRKRMESMAIEGFYGGDYWKDKPLTERLEYIQEKMLKPNLEKYGYANKEV